MALLILGLKHVRPLIIEGKRLPLTSQKTCYMYRYMYLFSRKLRHQLPLYQVEEHGRKRTRGDSSIYMMWDDVPG